jgi:hypothetical protein
MRTLRGTALLILMLGLAGTASAQTSTSTSTTLRPGQLQAPSQPFQNFFPGGGQITNIFSSTIQTPTSYTMPQSYLQQFGYQRVQTHGFLWNLFHAW